MDETKLDRRLHELMGRCWHEFNNDCMCQKPGCGVDNSFSNRNPHYTTSISDAFEAVEWARKEKGFCIEILGRITIWDVEIEEHETGHIVGECVNESLPTAITLALINALETNP